MRRASATRTRSGTIGSLFSSVWNWTRSYPQLIQFSVFQDGRLKVIQNDGSPTTPSFGFLKAKGELLIGADAKSQSIYKPSTLCSTQNELSDVFSIRKRSKSMPNAGRLNATWITSADATRCCSVRTGRETLFSSSPLWIGSWTPMDWTRQPECIRRSMNVQISSSTRVHHRHPRHGPYRWVHRRFTKNHVIKMFTANLLIATKTKWAVNNLFEIKKMVKFNFYQSNQF